MQGIFVSYRRQDSQSAAGRLSDHLRDHLDGVPIFRDVETIEPGVDFVDAIDRALRACGVVLAVIGPRWVDAANAQNQRRLDDPNDYTRLEIATALKRDGVRVIPVLVDGAEMPTTEQLPDDLQALARRNATELTDKRWRLVLAVAPDAAVPSPALPPLPRLAQGSGDLGDRMARVFGALPGPVLIVGADIPGITRGHVAAGFRALGAHDAVIGPAPDGGYWAIGLKQRRALPRGLFAGVRWSSEHAFRDTLVTLSGLRTAFLPELADVDCAADLGRDSR